MKWMRIIEYPNYLVSDTGEIYNEKTHRYLKPSISTKGYLVVNLYNKGKPRTFFVHVLVALNFVPGRTLEKKWVNHKDENKQNPAASNLEWCTDGYNKLYSASSLKSCKAVLQILDGCIVNAFFSSYEVQRQLGFSQSMICRACKTGVQAYGYRWEYADGQQ